MILGVGVDSVEISRFAQWHSYASKQLLSIFTPREVEYCLQVPSKSAERFAVRFAAKEALYKALPQEQQIISFRAIARFIEIKRDERQKPCIVVAWEAFLKKNNAQVMYKTVTVHVSLTHTQHLATAFVILESA